jgi:hypothetical protein
MELIYSHDGKKLYFFPDASYLFFVRQDAIYWVNTEIMEYFKPKELK